MFGCLEFNGYFGMVDCERKVRSSRDDERLYKARGCAHDCYYSYFKRDKSDDIRIYSIG